MRSDGGGGRRSGVGPVKASGSGGEHPPAGDSEVSARWRECGLGVCRESGDVAVPFHDARITGLSGPPVA